MAVHRDEGGRVLPGSVLNPKGRPKDENSFTAMLKKWLDSDTPDGSKNNRQAIIATLINKARNGEKWAVELVINRCDGLLTQQVQQLTKVEIVRVDDAEWSGNEPVDDTTETSAVPTGGASEG